MPCSWLKLWSVVKVDARKAGKPLLAPSGASSSKETHPFGWRNAMDIIVKWRQLSEPNDQVQRPHAMTSLTQLTALYASNMLPSRHTGF